MISGHIHHKLPRSNYVSRNMCCPFGVAMIDDKPSKNTSLFHGKEHILV